MITIEKEPDELFNGVPSECCAFCGRYTRMWNLETNNPVCAECSEEHDIFELVNYRTKGGLHDTDL